MGLSNSKDPLKNIYPQKIKGKNICFLQGWMGLFFLEQKETLLQISPVPHRSDFFNFLFQIVKWGNFAETLMYNTLCFTFASPEIQKNRVRPHCAMAGIVNGTFTDELACHQSFLAKCRDFPTSIINHTPLLSSKGY